jgi:hypothetical protein
MYSIMTFKDILGLLKLIMTDISVMAIVNCMFAYSI